MRITQTGVIKYDSATASGMHPLTAWLEHLSLLKRAS